METVIIQGKKEPDGSVKFKWPNGKREEDIRYVIEYKHNGIIYSQTWHPFWEIPYEKREGVEKYRMLFLDFSKYNEDKRK